ncbi:MAG: DUF1343 domain-containing protein [Bacteroidales bacterium]|nr:DUF1343 domain-containing protein [Bacteroidales bacterium]
MNWYTTVSCIAVFLGLQLFQACVAKSDPPGQSVHAGADQTSLYFPLLEGKSVGLVANHTSVTGQVHLADTLIRSGINLVKIFAPEHGFRGTADAGENITNGLDSQTGVPIISLYGSKSKPSAHDLKGIDVMVYDIQDVGVRFYTYISTLHYVMEACAENDVPLVILDRPDPLGHYVDGPVLDKAFRSFVGMHPIPVVYGMTAGELARMINGEGWLAGGLACDLKVIPCDSYDHNTFYSLPVDPSPNLNSMEAVYLYPSLCIFEGTIMSLGRGTPTPFRVVGHPEYPDKTFSFTPKATAANKNPVHRDKICYGTDFRSMPVADLQQMRGLNLQWLLDAYTTMGKKESFFTDYIDKLAGTGSLRKQIMDGMTEEQIRQTWQEELVKFKVLRKKYILYKDFE